MVRKVGKLRFYMFLYYNPKKTFDIIVLMDLDNIPIDKIFL